MSYIPENLIEEIRNASEIVDVISDYVTLKKRGANFTGLCPFHHEKTPSFSVHQEKQIFKCFGCGASGNVFSFIMREMNIDFPAASRLLAQRSGIQIPENENMDREQMQAREGLYFANEAAMTFYQKCLFEKRGEKALAYLHARGFDDDGIRAFQLGYAPDGWDNLLKDARSRQIHQDVLEKAGLVNKKEDGGAYDRFRDRLMFPIINLSGKVVAFGGRCLVDDKKTPKYVNSPETDVYHKSNILYGLFQAKDAIRQEAETIFVEGYTDVMRLSLSGQKNVVATSGTSLTELQARLIRRYTSNATLLYDSDKAGAAATMRGADILVEQDLEVKVAEMPEGEDPDSFVQKFGVESLRQKLAAALPLLDFKSLRIPEIGSKVDRTEELHAIIATLAKIQDGLKRQEAVHTYAEKLKIDEKTLWEEIARLRALKQRRQRKKGEDEKVEVYLPSNIRKTYGERSRLAEQELIRIMLLHWEAIPFIFGAMEITDFYNDDMRLIATVLYKLFQNEVRPEPEEFIHYFTEPEVTGFVSSIVLFEAERDGIPGDFRVWAADCLVKLQRIMLDMKIEDVNEKIADREKSGGDPGALLAEWRDLHKQRQAVHVNNFLPKREEKPDELDE